MTNEQIVDALLAEQYKMAGLDYETAKTLQNNEFVNYRLTIEQMKQWYIWAIDFVKKNRKSWTAVKCRKEVGMLDFQHGLNVNYDTKNKPEHSPD